MSLLLTAGPTLAQNGYRIKSGDVVRIEVLEDPNLNRSVLVLPDGRISVPLAGTVQASGLTLEELQANLVGKLAPNFAATPTVFVGIDSLSIPAVPVTNSSIVAAPFLIDVYMLGEAANPGKYEVGPGTTLLQFFAQSGGFSKFAATKRIQLRRVDASGVERVYTFDYNAMERGAISNRTTVMAEGDVIIVPQRRLFE
jgi:polysaccharide export outer membrane protein